MPDRIRRLAITALLVVASLSIPMPAGAGAPTPSGIGIKLLEGPTNRRHDPRAYIYIVDHLPPGATIRRRLSVENNTRSERHLKIYAGGATVGKEGFTFTDDREPSELVKWISFDRGSLDLRAGEKATMVATVQVPPEASTGERYAVIWAENQASSDVSGNVGMSNRVGVRIYLDIGPGGEPPSDFEIEALTPGRDPDGRPKLIATVRNTGARALDLSGVLELSDGPGSLSAGPFPVDLGITLGPGHTGSVRVHLDKRLPEGPWTAKLILRSGTVERTVGATITFPEEGMGTPVKPEAASWATQPLMVGVVLAALLVVPILLLLRRRTRRRADQLTRD